MPKMIIVLLMAILLIASCFTARKVDLSADPRPYEFTVKETYDTVWERIKSFFALYEINIQRMNKTAGLLSSYEEDMSRRTNYYRDGYNRDLFLNRSPNQMSFYIRVTPRKDSDSVDVSMSIRVLFQTDPSPGGDPAYWLETDLETPHSSLSTFRERFLKYIREGK